MRLERSGGYKGGLDLCLNLGCARERPSVWGSGWKWRVWTYSLGRVVRVDPVDLRVPRVYSGPQAGRYGQTHTASAAVRCSASKLKYQGKQFPTDQEKLSLKYQGEKFPKYQEEKFPKYPSTSYPVPQVPKYQLPSSPSPSSTRRSSSQVPGGGEVLSADTRRS